MKKIIFTSSLRAQDVASYAFAVSWADTHIIREHLVKSARDKLVQLLAGEPAGTKHEVCREALIDLIGTAIVDSTDIDCTSESQAEAILAALLNSCLPVPSNAEHEGEKA